MQSIRIYFDETDTELTAAIVAMPKGERSARLKGLIGLALAGTGGLLVRIEALEREMASIKGQPSANPAPPAPPTIDVKQAAHDLFKRAGAFDD